MILKIAVFLSMFDRSSWTCVYILCVAMFFVSINLVSDHLSLSPFISFKADCFRCTACRPYDLSLGLVVSIIEATMYIFYLFFVIMLC